jgi:GWxTD domain-containing protein
MSVSHRNGLWLGLLLASVCFSISSANAQDQSPVPQSSRSWPDPTVKEIYKKWLREDVAWIITDQERIDYTKLSTDKERDDFVVAFWEHRNPTPGSSENKFKAEHYRRLAYANTHFAAGVPGWRTDRGRIYILYGPSGAGGN